MPCLAALLSAVLLGSTAAFQTPSTPSLFRARAVVQVAGSRTRSSTVAPIRMVMAPQWPGATETPPASENTLRRWHSGVQATLEDRRRIDELVGQFYYEGEVVIDGVVHAGQGAVKRVLTEILLRETGTTVEQQQLGGNAAEWIVQWEDGSWDMLLEIESGPPTSSDAVIRRLTLTTRSRTAPKQPSPLEEQIKTGPKWETYDGRVRQQIWQHAGLFESGNPFLKEKMELTEGRLITIIDETVWKVHGEKIQIWCESVELELVPIVAPGNEDQKTMDNMLYMLDKLATADPLRRSEPVLAVGGGVLTDVAGFACALWRRGVPWCRLPTTLLGMVDASVGIKVAVNHHRKNGVGHFFSPSHTFVDSSFLASLPLSEIRSGVGEIMKAALVHDGRLFDLMETHGQRLIHQRFMGSQEAAAVIKFSVDTMLECIGPDLWEESLVRPMDFGHSFSRTLEGDSNYKLRHGEAVAIDCIMSACISEQKGLMTEQELDRVLQLYAALGLPCSIDGINADIYKEAVQQITVHRDGLLRAPLPKGIGGCAYVDSMTDAEVEGAFERLSGFMKLHPETSWNPEKSFIKEYKV